MQGTVRAASVLLLLLALAVQLQHSSQTEYISSGKDICRLFPDGTKIRKPGYCDRTVVCQNHVSIDDEICSGSTSYFNLAKGTCYKSLETSDNYCKSPCTSKTTGYVGDTFNCANWYYCEKTKLVTSGVCGFDMWFDQERQVCDYPKFVTCNAKYDLCNVVPAGITIKDELYCNKYLTCKAGTNTTIVCDDGLYYDVTTATCIKKALVDCEKHPYPENVCGTKKLAIRDKFVADGATCRGYFHCRDLGSGVPDPEPQWHQCPVETFFNEDIQLCQPRADRKCSEDRCDGRDSGFELAQIEGCQNYFECENGVEKTPFKCDNNMYFDVATQTCTAEKKEYGSCSSDKDKYDPNNWVF
ncbi:peritrophin-44 [Drosophila novamexicana]|uniref:peritrophin-44 n=1 Tax=Drosophila novamexicana TaxID=47314 RepID=UPI0011E590E9|nr:peritrophin-44 [Drosophila novamexicana]